ncbi:MAG: dihydrodipicolinate synthase family protein [Candidatus Aminicenantaceae bacterium]
MNNDLNGVLAAVTTPFKQDKIFLEKFKENILKYDIFDLKGYIVSGTTGEIPLLSDEESEKLVQTAKETASSGKVIIAGTAKESTKHTIELSNRMAQYGIHSVLVRTPGYYRAQMTREALREYYLNIADHIKVPLIVYNIPEKTGVSMEGTLIAELSSHPNIAGIKDSSGNLTLLGEVKSHCHSDFSWLMGAGSVFVPSLFMGADGGILRLADVAPLQCVQMYELSVTGNISGAYELQRKLIPINNAITKIYGLPGLKTALDLIGFYGGPVRSPLCPLDEASIKKIKETLRDADLV